MSDLNWELWAWQLDEPVPPEPGVLDSPAQRAHRLNNVESVFATDSETLSEWHRRDRS